MGRLSLGSSGSSFGSSAGTVKEPASSCCCSVASERQREETMADSELIDPDYEHVGITDGVLILCARLFMCVRACARACVRACVCACKFVCVRACVCVSVVCVFVCWVWRGADT